MRYAKFCSGCGAPAKGKFCTECGAKIQVIDDETGSLDREQAAGSRFGGLRMTGLTYHRAGMAMGKYQTLVPRDGGFDVVESMSPIPWQEIGGTCFTGMMPLPMMLVSDKKDAPAGPPTEEEIYKFGGAMVSIVRVSEEEGSAFFDGLVKAGLLGWDGFSKSGTLPPGTYDGQDSFDLRILFEDGQVLTASGSNAYPAGYSQVHGLICGFFNKHSDYSRYHPTKFPAEEPQSLEVTLGSDLPRSDFYAHVRLQKNDNKWWLCLRDRKSQFIELDDSFVDVGIIDGASAESLGTSRFIDVLKRHDMGRLNQTVNGEEGYGAPDRTELSISIRWSENRSYRTSFNAKTCEYENFFKDLVKEISDHHEKIKDTTILRS